MLSIFLVLILLLGVNYVFRTASDAIGTGQTANAISREQSASQPRLFDDFQSASRNPPCFIIASEIVNQFLNASDASTGTAAYLAPAPAGPDPSQIPNPNYNSSLPLSATNTITIPVTPGIYNYREHRADLVKFFAHGYFPRRGANPISLTTIESGSDAFITLGHVMLPSNDGLYFMGPTNDVNAPGYRLQEQLNTTTNAWNVVQQLPYQGQIYPTATQRVGSYASDWVLGRSVVLLKDQTWITENDTVTGTTNGPGGALGGGGGGGGSNSGTGSTSYIRAYSTPPTYPDDYYYARTPNIPVPYNANANAANMEPLCLGTPATDYTYYASNPNGGSVSGTPATADNVPFEMSRYDLAATTPDQFRRTIADAILAWQAAGYTGNSLWWDPLVYNVGALQKTAVGAGGTANTTPPVVANSPTLIPSIVPGTQNYPGYPYATGQVSAYSQTGTPVTCTVPTLYSFSLDGTTSVKPDLARMAANPLLQSPVTSAAIAQMSPYFLQHCSQFIVEYAGDYLQQNNNPLNGTGADPNAGAIVGLGPDGQIDYTMDANGNRRIKWYGMPRVEGSVGVSPPTIVGYNGTDLCNSGPTLRKYVDVIPLRDYYTMYYNTKTQAGTFAPPWEVDVNFPPYGNYADTTFAAGVPNNPFYPTATFQPRYVAAWYNDMPAMIRILIKVDDPNNKVKDGPWFEYVFKLK